MTKYTDNSAEILTELDAAVFRSLVRVAGQMETYAKNLVPVDTGNLKNSIIGTAYPEEGKAVVGTNVEYGVYQEMGTGKYAIGGGGRPDPWVYQDTEGNWHRTSGHEPQPFIKPAVADHAADYKKIIEDELHGR